MSDAERGHRAETVLARHGVAARVDVVGLDGDTVAIRAERHRLDAVRRAVPELKALGFRYVALDLAP